MTTIGPSLYCVEHNSYYPLNSDCQFCDPPTTVVSDPLIQGEATLQDHYNEYRPDKRDLKRENERLITALESINRIVTDMLDPERRGGPVAEQIERLSDE